MQTKQGFFNPVMVWFWKKSSKLRALDEYDEIYGNMVSRTVIEIGTCLYL